MRTRAKLYIVQLSGPKALKGLPVEQGRARTDFKLAQAAEKSWRRLDGHHHLPKVIRGIKFTNGIEVVSQKTQAAAA